MPSRISRAKKMREQAKEIRVLAEMATREDTRRTLKGVADRWEKRAALEAKKTRILYNSNVHCH